MERRRGRKEFKRSPYSPFFGNKQVDLFKDYYSHIYSIRTAQFLMASLQPCK